MRREQRSQFFPASPVDSKSAPWPCWYDCRNDAGTGGPGGIGPRARTMTRILCRRERGWRRDWLPNVRVSAGTSGQAASSNPNDYGDYTGLAFYNGPFTRRTDNSTARATTRGTSGMEIYTRA